MVRSGKPNIARQALHAVLGVIVAVILIEVGLRVSLSSPVQRTFDPMFGSFQRPDTVKIHSGEGYSHSRANQLGFFDENLRDPPPALRALVLGDSFTEALQVDQQINFTSVAERLSPDTEVCNAGRSGWGPPELAAFAIERGHLFDPDVLVIQYSDTDLREFTRPGKIRIRKKDGDIDLEFTPARLSEGRINRYGRWLMSQSALFTRVKGRIESLAELELKRLDQRFSDGKAAGGAKATKKKDPPEDSVELLTFLHERMTESHEDIVYLYIPFLVYDDAEGGRSMMPEHRRVFHEFTQRVGVTLIDPTNALLDEYRKTRQPCHGFMNSRIGHGHVNRRGHEIIGELLAQELRKRRQ